MSTMGDWESVEGETGKDNISSNNTIISSDEPASYSPPLKRPRLDDDPPKPVSFDNAELSSKNDIADFLSHVVKLPDIKLQRQDHHVECQKYAELVLADYKHKTGLDYEFTSKRSIAPFTFPCYYKGSHLNFYARLKGSSTRELFYAELDHREDKVYNSCILLPPDEPDINAIEFIIHPPHVYCEWCTHGMFRGGYWEIDSGDD